MSAFNRGSARRIFGNSRFAIWAILLGTAAPTLINGLLADEPPAKAAGDSTTVVSVDPPDGAADAAG
jgi:hypothetical protein